jgi:hypothetical protein
MKATDRDYSVLTPDEELEYARMLEEEKVEKRGKLNIRVNLFRKYPKATRHFLSLFPNNYLDIVDLENERGIKIFLNQLSDQLDDGTLSDERDIAR